MTTLNLSSIDIGNMALSHIGDATNFESFDQKGAAAGHLRTWYEFARVRTLEAYDWTFARKRFTLTTHGDAAPTEWAYRYQYPNDCVKARYLVNPAGKNAPPVPYEVEISDDGTRSIVTNLASAVLVFTADIMDPQLFSMHFVDAFSKQLAFKICWPLTKKFKVMQQQEKDFKEFIRLAPAMDANEEQEDEPPEVDWIRARN